MVELIKKEDKNQKMEIEGKIVPVTHLNKIFWPDEGYTKGDLINYYIKIAKYILPHLKDRPESLRRYPNGIKGKNFFQKNMDHQPPEWVKIIPIQADEKSETINYMAVNDLTSLIYMISLGAIDINPWNSHKPSLYKPDYLILDLDPEEIDFNYVLKTALEIKKVCAELKLNCYPETSGATGVHVYFPLGAKYSYGQCRHFAEILATLVHERVPKFTSLERAVSERKNKVYIDYLQNAPGQTLASVYSVRPRPKATVSTPLLWSEVEKGVRTADFTIENIFDRLKKSGDLFCPVLGEGIDITSALGKIGETEWKK